MSQSGKCSLSIDCGALQRQGGGIVFTNLRDRAVLSESGEAAAVVAMIDRQIYGDWQLVLGTQAPEQVRAALGTGPVRKGRISACCAGPS